jgi:hypothetical protein
MPARFYTSVAYTGNICISGAGTTIVNGTYTFIGYVTDVVTRPSYQKGNIVIGLISGRYYIVEAIGDQNGQYLGNTFPAPVNPYLETSWTPTENGVFPIPVITQGSC